MTEPLDLAALREIVDKATPGPWRNCSWDPMERPHVHKDDAVTGWCRPPDLPLTPHDAAYIAAFDPTTAAALLSEIESLRRVRDALTAMHGGQLGPHGHRAGDHFDECRLCAVIHGSGFAYPAATEPAEREAAR